MDERLVTPTDVAAEGAGRAEYDGLLDRLQLIGGDDEAIAAFLDEIDVSSTREREMLAEMARTSPLARPDRFEDDHRRVLVAIESLRRHGFHGTRAGHELGPLRYVTRFLVELVARYVVVTYVKNISTQLRNLYWFRQMQAPANSHEYELIQPARLDALALVEITRSREIGVPTFVLGGILIPVTLSVWRLASGFTFEHWWVALIVALAGIAIGLAISWVVLRGAALASRRVGLTLREPLRELWTTVGACGNPPRDHSRRFAIVAISLTIGVWIVLPLFVTISLAT